MVTCVPGQSACTASASTCAASCRISSSARGSSRVTNSIFGILVDRIGEIGERAVERHGDGALGERLGDAFGELAAGDAGGVLALRRHREMSG